MAIAIDSTSSGSGSATWTFSHTTSGIDRYLFVFIITTGSITSVTYNGVVMTLLQSLNALDYVYGLASPAIGTNTVSIITSIAAAANSVSYTGASGTQPVTIQTGGTGVATTYTQAITTTKANSWVIGFFMWNRSSDNLTAGTGSTLRVTTGGASTGVGRGLGIFDSNGTVTPGSYSMTVNGSAGSGAWDAIQFEMGIVVSGNASALLRFI